MKISLTQHEKTYSVESADDGLTVDQMAALFKGLMVSAGYHPECVDRAIDVEEQWFPETHENPNQMTLNWPGNFHNKHDQYEQHSQLT